MGGYILEDGRKLQTDAYIEHLEVERDAARAEVERLRGLIYGHRAAVVLQTTARDQDRALWENIERWEADHEA